MSFLSRRDSLIAVAKMYYIGELSQKQIADLVGASQTKVSFMLSECRKQKLVQFQIEASTSQLNKTAEKIKRHFNLKEVIIIPSETSADLTLANIGKAAAKYVCDNIKDNMLIGLSWGTTLSKMINSIETDETFPNCEIVQLTGGLNTNSLDIEGKNMTSEFARKLGAKFLPLHVPAFVQDKLFKDLLLKEPRIASYFELFDKLDMAIIGFGSSNPNESIVYKAGYISLEDAKKLIQLGVIGEICGRKITQGGYPANSFLSDRILSIELDSLNKTPIVIGIGAGNDKAYSIAAAANGKYVNIVIIDELAAIGLLYIEKIFDE